MNILKNIQRNQFLNYFWSVFLLENFLHLVAEILIIDIEPLKLKILENILDIIFKLLVNLIAIYLKSGNSQKSRKGFLKGRINLFYSS